MVTQATPTVERVKETIRPILIRNGVIRAGVFGSVVHGTMRPDSDVDVLVELDQSISLLGLARLKRELEEAIGRGVDLVEYQTIKERIRPKILAEEVRIL
jgi:predicted nucleotidyltransferase